MTEHEAEKHTSRRLAHERLSTGALANWGRACASHPWRVVFSWIGIVILLVVLVATVGGSLRDKFELPGTDTQKATDLIESQFASEQGGVLNVVFAAPEGQRLDTPARKAAIAKAVALLKSQQFKATKDKAGIESVGDPFAKDTFSDNGRIAYAEAQFDRIIYDKDRNAVVAVEDAARKAATPAGIETEFNGDAEFPPIQQGIQELLGLMMALIVLLIVFRTFVAASIPIALALDGARLGVPAPVHPRRADRHQHDHADPRLDDRARRRHRLLAVHRHALQAVPARGARRRATQRARLRPPRAGPSSSPGFTVAISVSGLAFFGLDFVTKLGIGAALGVLTTVLIANSLLIAVLRLLGHKVDRWKVPGLRQIDDSETAREKTLIARWGRFVTAHAKPLFIDPADRRARAGFDLGARPAGRVRPGHAAEEADRAPRL